VLEHYRAPKLENFLSLKKKLNALRKKGTTAMPYLTTVTRV
jgi:hypothetical protein